MRRFGGDASTGERLRNEYYEAAGPRYTDPQQFQQWQRESFSQDPKYAAFRRGPLAQNQLEGLAPDYSQGFA